MLEITLALAMFAVIGSVLYAEGDATRSAKTHATFIGVAGFCLAVAGFLVLCAAAFGNLVVLAAWVLIIWISAIFIPGGLTLFIALRSSRRWIPLLFAASSPLLLWGLMTLGDSMSPEERLMDEARVIIVALETYRSETGSYPESLSHLQPNYIEAFPVVYVGQFDWFYASDGETYQLGFIPDVDRWTYTVFLYSPDVAKWEFDFHGFGSGPFTVPPTPSPTPFFRTMPFAAPGRPRTPEGPTPGGGRG